MWQMYTWKIFCKSKANTITKKLRYKRETQYCAVKCSNTSSNPIKHFVCPKSATEKENKKVCKINWKVNRL